MEALSILSESTLVPIGFVLGGVASLIGFVAWLTKLHTSTSRNETAILELSNRMTNVERENGLIIEQLAIIRTKLDFLIEHAKEHKVQ